MNTKRFMTMLVTSLAALAVLIIIAFFMKKESDSFDTLHPDQDNPLSETSLADTEDSSSGQDIPGHAAGMTEKKDEEDSVSGNTVTGQNTEEDMTETEMPEEDRMLPDHQIIFVGDSRTVGLQNALGKLIPDVDCIFVGKVGEGCAWFLSEGEAEMAAAIQQYPDAPVVLNFGVNDPDQIDQYLEAYDDMEAAYPDTDFWYMSVNPVQREKMIENGVSEEALQLVTNPNITQLNKAFRQAHEDRYLDTSTMMKLSGFQTVDGLHYTRQTYLKIHRFVVSVLFG